MPTKYDSQYPHFSSLQLKIIKYIIIQPNSDYQSIAQELRRSRTTIFNSVRPLLRNGYVDQRKADLQRNSKVILSLSRKGKEHVWRIKLVSDEFLLSTDTDPAVLEYLKILKSVNDSSLQEEMMDELGYLLLMAPISDKQGAMKSEDRILAVKEAFFQGLNKIALIPDYDLRKLFIPTTIKWLNNIYNSDEKIGMKEYFRRIARNYETIVKGIDKTLPK